MPALSNPFEEYKRLLHLHLRARMAGDEELEESYTDDMNRAWLEMSEADHDRIDVYVAEVIHVKFFKDGALVTAPPIYSPPPVE